MNYEFTKKEKRIRKACLITHSIHFFLVEAYFIFVGVTGIVEGYCAMGWAFLLFFCTLFFLSFWLVWHCAYKNPGTKWLTFGLIWMPLYLLRQVMHIDVRLMEEFGTDLFYYILLLLPSCALFGWVWVTDFRLRKLNKKIKAVVQE